MSVFYSSDDSTDFSNSVDTIDSDNSDNSDGSDGSVDSGISVYKGKRKQESTSYGKVEKYEESSEGDIDTQHENSSDASYNTKESNKNSVTKKKRKCRCVSCSREVEDVLYLMCKHFLCLVCGSEQLNNKYEQYLNECTAEEQMEKYNKYDVKECFNNYKDRMKAQKRDINKELYKREMLGFINCCVCDVKSELSIETIELLMSIGLISSDILNVHKVYLGDNKMKRNDKNDEKPYLTFEDTKHISDDFDVSINSDHLKNEDLKKMKVSKQRLYKLNNQIDDLSKYSYICNICSYNEAILYCKDCVEYLCQSCFDNIHELEAYEKLNMECTTAHDYYKIDKNALNLKKLVKNPKKCYSVSDEEFSNITKNSVDDDEDFEETPFETYDENDPRFNHKIQDKDSDFDVYDEEHFNKRITNCIEKKNKIKKNEIISEKLNGLIEEMKDGSDYESNQSSCRGSFGSTLKRVDNSREIILKNAKKKKGSEKKRKKKKKDDDDSICSFHSGKSELISSDDDDYLNSKRKEVCITNVQDILNKEEQGISEKDDEPSVKNTDFTVIQNIRCPDHFGYPIQYYCHSCCNKCFCSECAINGNHGPECNIEHINTAFITILNKYLVKWNEIISDIINDLRRNFYESLKDIQSEWSSILSECFCELNSEINYIINTLSKKEIDILKSFDIYLQNFKKENLEYEELLKSKQSKIDEVIYMIRTNKYQTDPVSLIKFYRKNVSYISKVMLMNQDITAIENLAKIRESKIFYMDFHASQIMSYLQHLQSLANIGEPL